MQGLIRAVTRTVVCLYIYDIAMLAPLGRTTGFWNELFMRSSSSLSVAGFPEVFLHFTNVL